MARTLPNGTVVPAGADQFAYEKQMAALGLTAGGTIIVADSAEMESVVSQMRSAGYPPTRMSGRQFYLEDQKRAVIHDGTTAHPVESTLVSNHEPIFTGSDAKQTLRPDKLTIQKVGLLCVFNGVCNPAKTWTKGGTYKVCRIPEECLPHASKINNLGIASSEAAYCWIEDGWLYTEVSAQVGTSQTFWPNFAWFAKH